MNGPSSPAHGALAAIRRRFDLHDLHDAVGAGEAGRPVTATVLVQSVTRTDESERLLATAADDDLVAAVVGWVDLTGDVLAQLDRLCAGHGGRLLRGMRHLVQDELDPQRMSWQAYGLWRTPTCRMTSSSDRLN